MTRFDEITPLGQNFGCSLKVYFVLGKILEPNSAYFYDVGQIFISVNGPNSKYNLAIWSCCRPTVHIPPVIFSSFFCKISYKRRKYGKETAESNKTISDLNIAGCNKIRFFQGRLSEYNHWQYFTKIKLSSKDFEYIILFILIL